MGRSRSCLFCLYVCFGVCEDSGQKGPTPSTPLSLSGMFRLKNQVVGFGWLCRTEEQVGGALNLGRVGESIRDKAAELYGSQI